MNAKTLVKVLVCTYFVSEWLDLLGLKLYYLYKNDGNVDKAMNDLTVRINAGTHNAKETIKKAWYKDHS